MIRIYNIVVNTLEWRYSCFGQVRSCRFLSRLKISLWLSVTLL